jgi:hypothetical protein
MDIVCYLDKKGITILACFPVHRSKNDRVYANNTMPVSKPKKYVYLGLFPVVFEFYNSDLIYDLTLLSTQGRQTSQDQVGRTYSALRGDRHLRTR